MNPAQLIKMANQIGTFFEAMPDREQAVLDIASHIQRSWEPRMIHNLKQQIDSAGWDGVSDIVRRALAEQVFKVGD